jgi:regulator of replication initiation timing
VRERNVWAVGIRRAALIGGFWVVASALAAWAQTAGTTGASSSDAAVTVAVQQLQQQVGELRAAVAEMRAEAAQYRQETAELRRELQDLRGQPGAASVEAKSYPNPSRPEPSATETAPQTALAAPLEQRVASLEETTQLLNSKIEDQYQTKVESASKYRVRLSGIALMNLFSNRGTTDNMDIPSLVMGPNQGGNFGATLRQSEVSLEVFGPTLAGAKTSAEVQADFAGGFPNTWNGVNSGIFRLQLASARLDWPTTSVVVGQDSLFISPLSPTSFASLAVPAFNYAGNLWAWTPQVRVEHRFNLSDTLKMALQAGILDNLTGEFPANSYFRSPGPGENSGQPAYALRTAWTTGVFGRSVTLGTAGYYSRQDWNFNHNADGWAGMVDWEIPLVARLELTGEFYRGRAVGGIGGGISRSVLFLGDPDNPATAIRPLDSRGGWSQLKLRATSKLEFNAGFGIDNPTAAEVRLASGSQPYVGPLLTQNRAGLINFVYRPRSNLLFSTEYRHLRSFPVDSLSNSAQQVNMVMGVLF